MVLANSGTLLQQIGHLINSLLARLLLLCPRRLQPFGFYEGAGCGAWGRGVESASAGCTRAFPGVSLVIPRLSQRSARLGSARGQEQESARRARARGAVEGWGEGWVSQGARRVAAPRGGGGGGGAAGGGADVGQRSGEREGGAGAERGGAGRGGAGRGCAPRGGSRIKAGTRPLARLSPASSRSRSTLCSPQSPTPHPPPPPLLLLLPRTPIPAPPRRTALRPSRRPPTPDMTRAALRTALAPRALLLLGALAATLATLAAAPVDSEPRIITEPEPGQEFVQLMVSSPQRDASMFSHNFYSIFYHTDELYAKYLLSKISEKKIIMKIKDKIYRFLGTISILSNYTSPEECNFRRE
ncbi:Protein of unknown function [Gryllus bimaculatus]|nr:Protein of unknown function [Gryllus bimaculatus]